MAEQSLHLAAAEPPAGADATMIRSAVRHSFVRAFRITVMSAAVLAALSAIGGMCVGSHRRLT